MIACSMDLKAFDSVSPDSLSLVMKDLDIAPMLAEAIMTEQIGGRYDNCFQVSGRPFDKTIKQGGKGSPCLFIRMMRSVSKPLQEKWSIGKGGSGTEDW